MFGLLGAVLASVMGIGMGVGVGVGTSHGASATADAVPQAVTSATTLQHTGDFRFTGGKSQRQSVTDAIERAVQALLPVFHDMARRRLAKANAVPNAISMEMEGQDLVIRYGNELEPMRAPLDGSVRTWHNHEGTRIKLKFQKRGDNTLVQTTWGGGGRRTMVWKFDQDGERVRLHSTMSSPSLPLDVEYRLTFRR